MMQWVEFEIIEKINQSKLWFKERFKNTCKNNSIIISFWVPQGRCWWRVCWVGSM